MMETFPYSNIKHGSENLLSNVSVSNITLTNFWREKEFTLHLTVVMILISNQDCRLLADAEVKCV